MFGGSTKGLVMREYIILILLLVAAVVIGCTKKGSNGTQNSKNTMPTNAKDAQMVQGPKKILVEGDIHPLVKHDCIRRIDAQIFLSKPIRQDFDEETKKTIEAVLTSDQTRPVFWVRMNININDLFTLLREQDPTTEGFTKDDFLVLVDKAKLTPIAPNGIIEVKGLNRFLRQDLILHLSPDISDIEVVIGPVSLAKFTLSQVDGSEL